MKRCCSLVALSFVVLGAALLLRAQPLPQPFPPATPAADPFAAPPAPAEAPADTPLADPFGAAPAAPPPKPAAGSVVKTASPLRLQADFAARSFLVNAYNKSLAPVVVPPQCEIVFADESLGKDVLKKMTPAERMAYHLDRPARIMIYTEAVMLADLIPELSKQLQVNVELDHVPLVESAFDRESPIHFQMTYPANLGVSLHRLLKNMGLDYVRLNDTLLITTRPVAGGMLFVKAYSLDREMFRPKTAWKQELQYHAQAGQGGNLGAGGNWIGTSSAQTRSKTGDDDPFVDIIQHIKPSTWKVHGGQGSLHLDLRRSLLVVNQTQEVHDQIEVLLADLRKIARSNQQAIQANAQLERRVVFRLKLPEKQAGPAQPFGNGLPGNITPLEPAFTMKEVADLIKQQVEPHTWKDEKHSITILGECLIINQSEAVQSKIHQFLRELGITREQFDENNRPFYGFS